MPNPWDLQSSQMPTEEELLAIQASQPSAPEDNVDYLGAQSVAPSGKKIKMSRSSLQKQFVDAFLQDQAQQREGIKSIESRQDAFRKGPGKVDLSPLLALADAWGGTNMARVYRAPMSDEQREQMALRLQEELQQRRNELTKTNRDFVKDQLMLELQAQKGIPKPRELSDQTVEDLSNMDAAVSGLADLRNTTSSNAKFFGPGVGQMSKLKAWGGVGKEGQELAAIQSQFNLMTKDIGKGIEGNRMTDADQRFYEINTPNLGDAPETVEKKIANIEKRLAQKKSARLSTAQKAGFNVERFSADDRQASQPQRQQKNGVWYKKVPGGWMKE